VSTISVPRSRFASGQQPETKNLTINCFTARDRTQKPEPTYLIVHWQITQFAADANMLRLQTHFNSLICRPLVAGIARLTRRELLLFRSAIAAALKDFPENDCSLLRHA
jgi:hypothetical protein